MKQWTRSMLLLAIPALVWGCKSDPTVPSTTGIATKLVASPQTLFIAQGDSEAVSVQLRDANDNPVPAGAFTFTTPASASFSVHQDTSQTLVYDAAGNLVQPTGASSTRFFVAATGYATSTFDVTAGGLTTTITVTSTPVTLPTTASTGTPAIGEAVVLTAPAGTFFRPTSVVSFPGVSNAIVTALAADSSSISFLVQPGTNGIATVSNVGIRANPPLTFTVPTTSTVSLPAPTAFSGTLSTAAPASGQSVVLTGVGFKVSPSATVTVGGADAVTIGSAADSSTLTFVPTPGSSGALVITGAAGNGFALGPLPTGLTVTAGAGPATAVAGTDAFGTAPTLSIADGHTVGVVSGAPFGAPDAGGFGGTAQLFQITLVEKTDLDISIPFVGSGSDLGVYIYDNTMTGLSDFVDAGGGGATESGTVTLDPGTYYLAVVWFNYTTAADYYGLQITPHAAP